MGEEELVRLTTESTNFPLIENHDSPQLNVNHYIRDIIREQSLNKPIK
jgi:hypothetical protein